MENTKCKYCGSNVIKGKDICNNCYQKEPLIRKLLQMVNDTFEMYGKMGDIEKLIELLKQVKYCGVNVDEYYLRDVAKHLLANDFTKVVRCKDCKYWEVFMLTDKSRDYGCCKHTYDRFSEETCRHRHKTDFCSYGELKELG